MNKIWRDSEDIKKNQMELLEMKIEIFEIKKYTRRDYLQLRLGKRKDQLT